MGASSALVEVSEGADSLAGEQVGHEIVGVWVGGCRQDVGCSGERGERRAMERGPEFGCRRGGGIGAPTEAPAILGDAE